MSTVKVYVGYGWQRFDGNQKQKLNGMSVKADAFWASIRERFLPICKRVSKSTGCRIEFLRLKASIGQHILPSVLRKIEKSDVLLFDLASVDNVIPGKKIDNQKSSYNANVLIECGMALALKKDAILMCPQHLSAPSDLSGMMLAIYAASKDGGELVRCFDDEISVQTAFIGMLRRACRKCKEMECKG